MYYQLLWPALLAFAVTAVVATPVQSAAAATESSHEGLVLSVDNGMLQMTMADGSHPHSHKIGASVAITRDGKTAQLSDLKRGDHIKVTTRQEGDTKEVVAVDATSQK